jgi:hypothetical protein
VAGAKSNQRSFQFSLRWLLATVLGAALGALAGNAIATHFLERDNQQIANLGPTVKVLVGKIERLSMSYLDDLPAIESAIRNTSDEETLRSAFGAPDANPFTKTPPQFKSWTFSKKDGSNGITIIISIWETHYDIDASHKLANSSGSYGWRGNIAASKASKRIAPVIVGNVCGALLVVMLWFCLQLRWRSLQRAGTTN